MNQDDIYNLLLLLLLMSNERDGDGFDRNDGCNRNDNRNRTTRGSLNELIIASMLMSSCNNRDEATLANALNACNRARNNTNTTF